MRIAVLAVAVLRKSHSGSVALTGGHQAKGHYPPVPAALSALLVYAGRGQFHW